MIFKLVFRKKLRFDEDICWLISQDLEHLTTLHSKTNERVSIDYIVPDLSKKYLYLARIDQVRRTNNHSHPLLFIAILPISWGCYWGADRLFMGKGFVKRAL